MNLLTHLTQIFVISDLIILVSGIGMLGVLILVAHTSPR
jgi:hypothetical protein